MALMYHRLGTREPSGWHLEFVWEQTQVRSAKNYSPFPNKLRSLSYSKQGFIIFVKYHRYLYQNKDSCTG